MSVQECWFCATPVRDGEFLSFQMRWKIDETFLIIALEQRWKEIWVTMGRCERCRFGHVIEKVTFWVLVPSAVFTVMPSLLMLGDYLNGSPWVDSWQIVFPWIWTLTWLGLWWGIRQHTFGWHRLAPRPERHARQHPTIMSLADEGWEYGEILPQPWSW